ncbi:hypothetical protein AVEN_235734-1 [Araneus ventricosus]|uniref:Uncharacterized protein n=1 Tax=Araneus ventricosus TaxID=182803 RepID=A0A4Y2HLZ8_ARAVE|nr:hypothetical protein AVEN_235734-1 [Araneus ventricosus]
MQNQESNMNSCIKKISIRLTSEDQLKYNPNSTIILKLRHTESKVLCHPQKLPNLYSQITVLSLTADGRQSKSNPNKGAEPVSNSETGPTPRITSKQSGLNKSRTPTRKE